MNPLKEFVYRLRGDYTTERLIKMGLVIGKNFKRMTGTTLDPSHCWLITIGDDVTLAPRVQILAHDASTCIYTGYAKIGRVNIGDRVFVGANTVILPNVDIGDDVIIGAGSVVTNSIPSGMVCAGNPAHVVCTTADFIAKHRGLINERPVWDDAYTLRKSIDAKKKAEQKSALADGIGYVQ